MLPVHGQYCSGVRAVLSPDLVLTHQRYPLTLVLTLVLPMHCQDYYYPNASDPRGVSGLHDFRMGANTTDGPSCTP